MLEILRAPNSEFKSEIFKNFDSRGETWVVSDLQSKWHLQRELIHERGVLEQTAVLRATELWQRFALQLFPQTHVLSHELAQTLFWNWIESMELPWARSPKAVPVVLRQMQMWMPVFSDPNFEDIMSQWFTENPEIYVRWGHWFELCATIWKRCQEENMLMISWLPAMLLSEDLSRLQWKKPLTFDLGPQISQVEGQLIRELGNHLEVRVIYPEAPWLNLMRNTLRPYELLLGEPEKGDENWQPEVHRNISYGRFSTQLAEVKDAVARVRGWLEEGVDPRQIAIVAPDIEEYWPVLRMYLREEGIGAAKPATARLGGFLEMAQWASSLRTAVSKISSSDLEVYLFSQKEKPSLSFDQFKVLFSNVYDAGDLGRAKQLFESARPPSQEEDLNAMEFLSWALGFWERDADTQRLTTLMQVIGQEVPRAMRLSTTQWLSYLEGVLARREITLRPAEEHGIWCVSVSSADWLPVTHGIFLNLNEGALRSVEHSPVSASEGQKVFADTGYAVGTNDRQELEFEFLWFLKKQWTALRLCFSATDFQGSVLTPSKLWMWSGFVSGDLKKRAEAPMPTRWDDLQAQPVDKLAAARQMDSIRLQDLQTALARDVNIEVNTWGPDKIERLSASSLERYWTCPFIFGAERKLKLSDEPQLDLDLDHRTRGRLLHAVVEELGVEPLNYNRSEAELGELVDSCRARAEIQLGDERLWPAIRAQHVRLAKLFLQFEKDWRARFPQTKTVGRELSFLTDWDGIQMAGRLDRVDRDEKGRYALIDYKATGGDPNWKSWLNNHQIQLALYSYLLETGKTELPAAPVVAANFYVVKESDRRKGFHLNEEGAQLYSAEDKHRNFITPSEKEQLFTDLQQLIGQAVAEIRDGKLNPNPADFKTCDSCSWRTLCRAPHLN